MKSQKFYLVSKQLGSSKVAGSACRKKIIQIITYLSLGLLVKRAKMGQFILTLTVLVLSFCKCGNLGKPDLHESRDTTIQLMDSLGTISLSFPIYTDTFLTWIRRSDCGKPCEEGIYRFQSKKLPIFKESGFYWIDREDSIEQLTISHSRNIYFRNVSDSIDFILHRHFKENLLAAPTTSGIISDTIERIDTRFFSIFEISDYSNQTGTYTKRLIAFTTLKGNEIQFKYVLLTKKKDSTLNSFLEESRKNLQSVRINKDN